MRTKFYIVPLITAYSAISSLSAPAQCTNAVLDWDNREYFALANSTVDNYVTLAQSQTQNFMFGANELTITHNYTTFSTIVGDNETHTGDAGSFATGADVQFIGNGQVTFTFLNSVSNLTFSMYDIDRSQRVTFGATDGATPRNISLATLSGTILTISNNNSTNARVDANTSRICNSSNTGTVNVSITGPVKTVTITVSNTGTSSSGSGCSIEDGSYWISDISACSPGGPFPSNYYAVSQPFTGMPSYFIIVRNNIFYYVDPTTGVAKYLFQDPTNNNMNSLAYDPYNRFLYYTYSLSGSGGSVNPNEKALRRYDVTMDTFGVVMSDITALGIPTFQQGVESGAAAFYDGHLYLGIEGARYTESIVWRISFNSSFVPVAASQVYAQDATATGGTSSSRVHDWADFGLNNGILYDFDGGRISDGSNTDFFHHDLLTGAVSQYTPLVTPRQIGIDWQGNIYNMGSSGASGIPGTIGMYNGTDDEGPTVNISYQGADFVGGSYGDAAEAFRPLCDFGDAPASYDVDPLSPAVNEIDSTIHLGSTVDREWNKTSSAPANADGADEDGIGTVTIFSNVWGYYYVNVSVYNHTGSNATLIGWFDYNGDGVFDAGEACTPVAVPSSTSQQNVYLTWTGISSSIPAGSYTYLRIRVTSQVYGMNSSHATGWFDNGETEDYRVPVSDYVLPVDLISFNAKAVSNSKVMLTWEAASEVNIEGYEVQKRQGASNWQSVGFVPVSNGNGSVHQYSLYDNDPYKGRSEYRLRIREANSFYRYSDIRVISLGDQASQITITPNPAKNIANISFRSTGQAELFVTDSRGAVVFSQRKILSDQRMSVDLPVHQWPSGTYLVSIVTAGGTETKKLVVHR